MTWLWGGLPLLLASVVGYTAWVIVTFKRLKVSDDRTRQALTGCPPQNRAAVLEAAGKYAHSLKGDRPENLRFLPTRTKRPV